MCKNKLFINYRFVWFLYRCNFWDEVFKEVHSNLNYNTYKMKKLYTLITLLFATTLFAQDLVVNVVAPPGTTSCRIGGPWWNGWDPSSGPIGTDMGNGSFQFIFSPAPTADMEYKFIIDGVYEDILDNYTNGECATRNTNGNINTDGANYANRIWKQTDALTWNEVAGTCDFYVLSNNEDSLLEFSLYPNPSTDLIQVTSLEPVTKVSIYDLGGRLVLQETPNKAVFELRTNNLSKGMYIIRLNSVDRVATKKILNQ